MKKILIILSFVLSFYGFSQDSIKRQYQFDNTITSMYNNNNGKKSFNGSFVGDNSVSIKKATLSFNTNYIVGYSPTLSTNEFIQKNNLSYNKFFISHVYNYSLSRSINSDNSLGVGMGFKRTLKYFNISLSYAIMYQYVNYQLKSDTKMLRNSFRLKLGVTKNNFKFTNEYYYQPNFTMLSDYIIYGNSKILLLPLNKISYTIQGNVNYRSKSNIKNIDNITFGITYTFKYTKYAK